MLLGVTAVCILLGHTAVNGQKSFAIVEDGTLTEYKDTLAFANAIQDQLSKWRGDRYLLANIDSVVTTADHTTAHLYKGVPYQYGNVSISEQDQQLIGALGLSRYQWKRQDVSTAQLSSYMDKIIRYLEDRGYPFASAGLTDVEVVDGTISAALAVDRGPYVEFDSLIIRGDLNVKRSYLRQYLVVQRGQPYSRTKYENISKRLRELPFLKLNAEPKLRFYDGKAELYLDADNARSSRFDFLIGVLPSTSAGQRQLTITGEFTAELYNRLGQGEYLYASFERVRPEVQELELKVRYPYIAGLPVGAAGGLSIYRRSSDFLEVESLLGADFQLSGNTRLFAGWNLKSSRLIDIDTAAILSAGTLPANLDVVYQGGNIGLQISDLDYRWNPTKGYQLTIDSKIGQKRILKNNVITSLQEGTTDFASSYDSLALQTLQLSGGVDLAYYIPLHKIITVQTRLRGKFIYNSDQVFANEYYRIGGNRLLRGFDEQSVLSESYALLTAEMRLLLDRNSYLTLPFIDFGYTRVQSQDQLIWDQVLGIGLGINFATPAGIFNVSFASGSRLDNQLNFNDTKVHFGYVSLF